MYISFKNVKKKGKKKTEQPGTLKKQVRDHKKIAKSEMSIQVGGQKKK